MKKLLFFTILSCIIFGCNISNIHFFKIIRNKTFDLDSVVLYRNNLRIFKYDSINRFLIREESIYFGMRDSLKITTTYDSSVIREDGNIHKELSIQYYFKSDSLYLVRPQGNFGIHVLFNKDTTIMVHENLDTMENEIQKLYYSTPR